VIEFNRKMEEVLTDNQLSENGKSICKEGELLGNIVVSAESCVSQNQGPADFPMSTDDWLAIRV